MTLLLLQVRNADFIHEGVEAPGKGALISKIFSVIGSWPLLVVSTGGSESGKSRWLVRHARIGPPFRSVTCLLL